MSVLEDRATPILERASMGASTESSQDTGGKARQECFDHRKPDRHIDVLEMEPKGSLPSGSAVMSACLPIRATEEVADRSSGVNTMASSPNLSSGGGKRRQEATRGGADSITSRKGRHRTNEEERSWASSGESLRRPQLRRIDTSAVASSGPSQQCEDGIFQRDHSHQVDDIVGLSTTAQSPSDPPGRRSSKRGRSEPHPEEARDIGPHEKKAIRSRPTITGPEKQQAPSPAGTHLGKTGGRSKARLQDHFCLGDGGDVPVATSDSSCVALQEDSTARCTKMVASDVEEILHAEDGDQDTKSIITWYRTIVACLMAAEVVDEGTSRLGVC